MATDISTERNGITLNASIHTRSPSQCAGRLVSLSRLIERLPEEDACRGMNKLVISTEIERNYD